MAWARMFSRLLTPENAGAGIYGDDLRHLRKCCRSFPILKDAVSVSFDTGQKLTSRGFGERSFGEPTDLM